MAVKDYYGEKQGTTYLEIFSIAEDTGEKNIHRELQDQEAYDTWHLSFYLKEILHYKKLLKQDRVAFEQIPRKEKNLLLYLILICQPQYKSVLELGSSLFEMIDGMELVRKYFQDWEFSFKSIDLKKLTYYGIEISQVLSFASQVLHPEYNISISPNVSQFKEDFDIFYDRSVTNYAFESSVEVSKLINTSEVALMNIFLSKEETFVSSRLGKKLTYFSIEELISYLKKPLFHLFGEKAPGPHSGSELSKGKPVVEGFFLCCEPELAENFIAIAQKCPSVKEYFKEKISIIFAS